MGTGHVINIAQNLEKFAPVLPRLVSDLPIVWLVREGKDDQFKLLQVRRRYVERALRWLKKNNPLYSNIDISTKRLKQLPVDGDISYEQIKKVPINSEFDIFSKLNETEEDNDDEYKEDCFDDPNVDDISNDVLDDFIEPTSFQDYDTCFNQDRDEEKMFEVPDDFVSKITFTNIFQNKLSEIDEMKINDNEVPDYNLI